MLFVLNNVFIDNKISKYIKPSAVKCFMEGDKYYVCPFLCFFSFSHFFHLIAS